VQKLREIGLQPDILLCRTDRSLPPAVKDKISLFCSVDRHAVIELKDARTIYEVPLALERERLDKLIAERLNIWSRAGELTEWKRIVELVERPEAEVDIAVVGKYADFGESYKSLNEALIHGGFANQARVNLKLLESRTFEDARRCDVLAAVDGVLVPGGFGERGVEGKVHAVRYAREHGLPLFGICLGLQLQVIEYARNVLGLKDANSSEFDPETAHPVIDLLPEQRDVVVKGASMRLGAFPCRLEADSRAARLYGRTEISERHRHRFEVNPDYIARLEQGGLKLAGRSPDGLLVEVVELPEHPWFLGCQFHPEFTSRPVAPHPLFAGFIRAALRHRLKR